MTPPASESEGWRCDLLGRCEFQEEDKNSELPRCDSNGECRWKVK